MPKQRKSKKKSPGEIYTLLDLIGFVPPGLDYFIGRHQGMTELAEIAHPEFERKLREQEAKVRDDVYNAADKEFGKQAQAYAKKLEKKSLGSFLNALKYDEENKRGIKQGILVRDKETKLPIHLLPTQSTLFDPNDRQYFPNVEHSHKTANRYLKDAFDNVSKVNDILRRGGKIKDTSRPALEKHESYFPRYKYEGKQYGTDEIEGLFQGKPVLISQLSSLPADEILEDIMSRFPDKAGPEELPSLLIDNIPAPHIEIDLDDIFGVESSTSQKSKGKDKLPGQDIIEAEEEEEEVQHGLSTYQQALDEIYQFLDE